MNYLYSVYSIEAVIDYKWLFSLVTWKRLIAREKTDFGIELPKKSSHAVKTNQPTNHPSGATAIEVILFMHILLVFFFTSLIITFSNVVMSHDAQFGNFKCWVKKCFASNCCCSINLALKPKKWRPYRYNSFSGNTRG